MPKGPLWKANPMYWVLGPRHRLIPVKDVFEWGAFFEDFKKRRVAQTNVGDANVSTVFLGIDHNFSGGVPLLFETMVFGGPHDDATFRYPTWAAAKRGHNRIVKALRDGENLDETDVNDA